MDDGRLDPLDTPRDRRDHDTEAMKVLRQVAMYVGRIEAIEEQRGRREREQAERTAQLQQQVDDVGVAVVGAVERMDSRLQKLEKHCADSTSAYRSSTLDPAPTSPQKSGPSVSIPPGTHPLVAFTTTQPVLALGMLVILAVVLALLAWHGMRLSTIVPGFSSSVSLQQPLEPDSSLDSSTD